MTTSKNRRKRAPANEEDRSYPRNVALEQGQGCERAQLAIFEVLCADVCAAFSEATRRQTESLAAAENRLTGLVGRCRTTAQLDAASSLKGLITKCVADAADDNVKIWADLVKRVQDNCARFDAARGASGADGPDGAPPTSLPRS